MRYQQTYLIQPPGLTHVFSEQDFDLNYWRSQPRSQSLTGGRGASQKIFINDEAFVLRRYQRGGMMARILEDQYLWMGLTRSRPSRELTVVQYALQHHLPVSQVAGCLVQRTGLYYRAAIISRFIENQGTLADCLTRSALDEARWFELGLLLRRLHHAGIDHADLNANNILIGDNNAFYLIDFDKARMVTPDSSALRNNLQRLRRSLLKIQRQGIEQHKPLHFSERDWQLLLQAYEKI